MFTKESKIIKNKENLGNYISGHDVFNSALLVAMSSPSVTKKVYVINKFEYRPDLIAEEFYGSTSYLGLLVLQASRGLECFSKGAILNLIPKSELDRILGGL